MYSIVTCFLFCRIHGCTSVRQSLYILLNNDISNDKIPKRTTNDKKILIITYKCKNLRFLVYAFLLEINKWPILSLLFSLVKVYM